jgi:hypothetical protein
MKRKRIIYFQMNFIIFNCEYIKAVFTANFIKNQENKKEKLFYENDLT